MIAIIEKMLSPNRHPTPPSSKFESPPVAGATNTLRLMQAIFSLKQYPESLRIIDKTVELRYRSTFYIQERCQTLHTI